MLAARLSTGRGKPRALVAAAHLGETTTRASTFREAA